MNGQRRRQNVQDGQLLFELNCARCHTEGWSTFDPTVPPDEPGGVLSLGLSGRWRRHSAAAPAFNLRDSGEIRRFGTDEDGGFAAQVDFVERRFAAATRSTATAASAPGACPASRKMLTKEYIEQIVSYERYCLDRRRSSAVEPVCVTGTEASDRRRPRPPTAASAKG